MKTALERRLRPAFFPSPTANQKMEVEMKVVVKREALLLTVLPYREGKKRAE